MKILVPEEIKFIIKKINDNNKEAYLVGGCVRDSILNKTPKDFDICTSALPEEIIEIFNEYDIIETGIKHGTVTLMGEDDSYEITTFRIDGKYSDGRHPDKVNFTSSLKEDLSRRDLTINSLAADLDGNIIDYFNGVHDIQNKIIKCVGIPEERFNEDALRILRTLRFASILNFEIEENTSNAVFKLYKNLENVSQERISNEFIKLLSGKRNTKIIREYFEIFSYLIPEFNSIKGLSQNNPHHDFDVLEHSLRTVENISNNDVTMLLSALFHDIGKSNTRSFDKNNIGHFYNHAEESVKITKEILKRMRFSNNIIDNVCNLIQYHDVQLNTSKKSILKLKNKLEFSDLNDLLNLKIADLSSKKEDISFVKKEIDTINQIKSIYNNLDLNKECFSIKHLNINGNDLIKLGLTPGKEFSNILTNILNMVLDEKIKNEKEILINYVKENYFKGGEINL